jgi:hypothetical protein
MKRFKVEGLDLKKLPLQLIPIILSFYEMRVPDNIDIKNVMINILSVDETAQNKFEEDYNDVIDDLMIFQFLKSMRTQMELMATEEQKSLFRLYFDLNTYDFFGVKRQAVKKFKIINLFPNVKIYQIRHIEILPVKTNYIHGISHQPLFKYINKGRFTNLKYITINIDNIIMEKINTKNIERELKFLEVTNFGNGEKIKKFFNQKWTFPKLRKLIIYTGGKIENINLGFTSIEKLEIYVYGESIHVSLLKYPENLKYLVLPSVSNDFDFGKFKKLEELMIQQDLTNLKIHQIKKRLKKLTFGIKNYYLEQNLYISKKIMKEFLAYNLIETMYIVHNVQPEIFDLHQLDIVNPDQKLIKLYGLDYDEDLIKFYIELNRFIKIHISVEIMDFRNVPRKIYWNITSTKLVQDYFSFLKKFKNHGHRLFINKKGGVSFFDLYNDNTPVVTIPEYFRKEYKELNNALIELLSFYF